MNKDFKINGLNYKVVNKLSEGSYGFISVVRPKNPDLFCKKYFLKNNKGPVEIVLKRMVAMNREKVELAKREVNFLKTFSNHSNPYYVRYFDSLTTINPSKSEGEFLILMEFRSKGTLWDLIATKFEQKQFFDEQLILT